VPTRSLPVVWSNRMTGAQPGTPWRSRANRVWHTAEPPCRLDPVPEVRPVFPHWRLPHISAGSHSHSGRPDSQGRWHDAEVGFASGSLQRPTGHRRWFGRWDSEGEECRVPSSWRKEARDKVLSTIGLLVVSIIHGVMASAGPLPQPKGRGIIECSRAAQGGRRLRCDT
jgi:hypothetical protein